MAQRDNLASVLGDRRVDELVSGHTTRAQSRFRFWAWLVGVAYIGAAIAAVVAALTVPDLVTTNEPEARSTTQTTLIESTMPLPSFDRPSTSALFVIPAAKSKPGHIDVSTQIA